MSLCVHVAVLVRAVFGRSMLIVFRRWGERPNERVITVGIGLVLPVSAFSGYIKLAYCSSAKGLSLVTEEVGLTYVTK